MEDEVVVGLCLNILEQEGSGLDPRNLQIQLQGFMARKAKVFVAELWLLLHSASQNESGVPTDMLEKKKAELLSKKVHIIVSMFTTTTVTTVTINTTTTITFTMIISIPPPLPSP